MISGWYYEIHNILMDEIGISGEDIVVLMYDIYVK